jgi:CHASE3 domain sensor protein
MTNAKRSLTSRNGVPFFVSAVLMTIAIGVGVIAIRRVSNASHWVGLTYNVIVQTNRCAALIRFAETEQRGFIITGRSEFLKSFNASADALDESLEKLTELVRDNETQAQRVKTMKGLIKYRLNDLESAASLGVIGQDERVEIVLAIRDTAQEITSEEYRLLDQRQDQMNRELRYAILTSCITGFLALAMGGHTFWVMRRACCASFKQGTQREMYWTPYAWWRDSSRAT